MLEIVKGNIHILSSNSSMPDWAYYLTLFLFFSMIIGFVIWSWMFAKWLTAGPKIKSRWKKIKNKFKIKKREKGIIIENGEVLIEEQYLEKINKKIEEAKNPQELLELQHEKENLEKSAKLEKKRIKDIEEEKLKKIHDKEEKNRIKNESKEISKKLKEKEKLKKQEEKLKKQEKEKK